jgi:hypothetical protein
MALTQSAWSVKTQGGKTVAQCNVAFTTAENDAYTLRTPKEIDVSKPYTLSVVCAATPDGVAVPFDLWFGYDDNFALSGNDSTVAPLVANTGAKFKQIFDDVVLAVTPLTYCFTFDPNQAVADVVTVAAIATGPKVKTAPAVCHVFNFNGGSTLNATNATFTIIQ